MGISPYPWKAKSEATLRRSGMPYTIIAAGWEAAAVGKTITVVNDEAMAPGAWRRDFGRLRADR